jgi:hypothetical protein
MPGLNFTARQKQTSYKNHGSRAGVKYRSSLICIFTAQFFHRNFQLKLTPS